MWLLVILSQILAHFPQLLGAKYGSGHGARRVAGRGCGVIRSHRLAGPRIVPWGMKDRERQYSRSKKDYGDELDAETKRVEIQR
jgi:hypothetical protein